MSTNDCSLISKRKQQLINGGGGTFNNQNDQCNSINLNQNNKCTEMNLKQPEEKLSNNYNNKNNNATEVEKYYSLPLVNSFVDSAVDKPSHSWKKNEMLTLSGRPSTNLYSNNLQTESYKWQKNNDKKHSSKINSSTLSLHIAAYENSIEGQNDCGVERGDGSLMRKSKQSKACKNVKSIFTSSNATFKNPFEFPRQQKDGSAEPEIMQFKGSQALLNPDKSKVTEKKTSGEQQPSKEPIVAQNEPKISNGPLKNQEDDLCASTQSSQTHLTPESLTPTPINNPKKISAECSQVKNNTEATQTLTYDYGDKNKVIQSPNYPSSISSDSSDTTQNFSQDDINPPVMPIKLPGRKLDVTRKSSKTKVHGSPKPHHKRRLLPKRDTLVQGGGDSTHKKRCFEKQRKRARKAAGPVVGRMRHKDFLRAVDRHREARNVIDCVCEPEQFGCVRTAGFYYDQASRQVKSFVSTFCCPPWPKTCIAKVAFWPPNRGYFFVSYAKHLPWSASLVQKHKIIKAKKQISLEEDFSIGLEHSCCDRVQGVTTFVIQNSYKNYIAGFIARPHKRIHSKLWIIYSHPNGSDLSDLMTLMPSPVQIADYLGATIVAYDYPGYGISTGKPSEKTFYSTIDAIIEYVTVTLEVPIESIVLWGYSIGTVCSVHAAMNHSVAGVFLFAPVASIMRTLKSNTCFDNGKVKDKTNCLDSFSNLDMISRVKAPLLIAHGEQDKLIPMSHGQALLEKAATTNSKTFSIWCKDVGHNNIPNSSELWKRVKNFLDHDINGAENLRATEQQRDQSKRSTRSKKSRAKKQTPQEQQSPKKREQQQQQSPTKSFFDSIFISREMKGKGAAAVGMT